MQKSSYSIFILLKNWNFCMHYNRYRENNDTDGEIKFSSKIFFPHSHHHDKNFPVKLLIESIRKQYFLFEYVITTRSKANVGSITFEVEAYSS